MKDYGELLAVMRQQLRRTLDEQLPALPAPARDALEVELWAIGAVATGQAKSLGWDAAAQLLSDGG